MVPIEPRPERSSRRTLVLGVGNLLLGDEGFGIHAVRRLQLESLPEGISVEDGGTGGLDLLELMRGFDSVILIDAVIPGGEHRERGSEAMGGWVPGGASRRDPVPGEVVVFRLNRVELTNPDPDLSLHGCSLGGLLRLAKTLGVALPEITVVGYIPESVSWSTELSPTAVRALATALERVRELVREGAAVA